jgi:hypothetical protein
VLQRTRERVRGGRLRELEEEEDEYEEDADEEDEMGSFIASEDDEVRATWCVWRSNLRNM